MAAWVGVSGALRHTSLWSPRPVTGRALGATPAEPLRRHAPHHAPRLMVAAAQRKQRSNPFADPPPPEDPQESMPAVEAPPAPEAEPEARTNSGRKGRYKARQKQLYAMERGVALQRKGAKLRKLEDIKVGDRIGGRVRVVMDYGVIVNARCEQDALLHVTQIPKSSDFKAMQRGSKLHDLAVIEVDPAKRVLKVSMRPQGQEPGGYLERRKTRIKDLSEGDVFEATAKKFLQKTNDEGLTESGGVFIDFGAQLDGYAVSDEGIPTWGNARFQVQVAKGGLDEEQVKRRKRVLVEVLDEHGNVVRPPAAVAALAAAGAAAGAAATGAPGKAEELATEEEWGDEEEEWGEEEEWEDEEDKWADQFDDF